MGKALAIGIIGLVGFLALSGKKTGAAVKASSKTPTTKSTNGKVDTAALSAKIKAAAAAGQETVIEQNTAYNVPSIVASAEDIVGVPVSSWLDTYVNGQVNPDMAAAMGLGQVEYSPIATGVYTAALPQQAALREQFSQQTGQQAPAGGYFQTLYFSDGTTGVSWNTDAVHPAL